MVGQEFFVIAIIAVAVAYLGWHFWRKRRRQTGCQACRLMQAARESHLDQDNPKNPSAAS